MILRNIVTLFAVAGISCNAFVPSRTTVPLKVQIPTSTSQNTNFEFLSNPKKRTKTAVFMSDAAADVPEPENKNLLQKVCLNYTFQGHISRRIIISCLRAFSSYYFI